MMISADPPHVVVYSVGGLLGVRAKHTRHRPNILKYSSQP